LLTDVHPRVYWLLTDQDLWMLIPHCRICRSSHYLDPE
jgi:hypothetical protein